MNIGKLWAAYADAILNEREFHPDFSDAVEHHRLMDAVQRASDTGQMQEV